MQWPSVTDKLGVAGIERPCSRRRRRDRAGDSTVTSKSATSGPNTRPPSRRCSHPWPHLPKPTLDDAGFAPDSTVVASAVALAQPTARCWDGGSWRRSASGMTSLRRCRATLALERRSRLFASWLSGWDCPRPRVQCGAGCSGSRTTRVGVPAQLLTGLPLRADQVEDHEEARHEQALCRDRRRSTGHAELVEQRRHRASTESTRVLICRSESAVGTRSRGVTTYRSIACCFKALPRTCLARTSASRDLSLDLSLSRATPRRRP